MERHNRQDREWQSLSDFINDAISDVAESVDRLDGDSAEALVTQLNILLANEELVGSEVELSTNGVIVHEERLDHHGLILYPVLDRAILAKNKFTGVFTGFTLFYNEECEERQIAYSLNFTHNSHNYVAIAPESTSKLKTERVSGAVGEPEDEDLVIHQAFEVISSATDDEGYKAAVELLEQEFMAKCNNDQERLLRLRVIGQCATEMLASKHYSTNQQHLQAMHNILYYSLDGDVEYVLTGYSTIDHLDEESGFSDLRVDTKPGTYRGMLEGIEYVSNFEITTDSDGNDSVVRVGGFQPVVCLVSDKGDTVKLPMKHLLGVIEDYVEPSCEDFNRKFSMKVHEDD